MRASVATTFVCEIADGSGAVRVLDREAAGRYVHVDGRWDWIALAFIPASVLQIYTLSAIVVCAHHRGQDHLTMKTITQKSRKIKNKLKFSLSLFSLPLSLPHYLRLTKSANSSDTCERAAERIGGGP